jgi:hypothetical protein
VITLAVLDQTQCRKVFADTGPRMWALFGLYNVTSGDTVDMAALNYFTKVNQAMIMGCTVSGTAEVATSAGAVITMPTGLAGDSAYLLVDGIPV